MRKITFCCLVLFMLACAANLDVERMAKVQVEKTIEELALNPESVQLSDFETVFKTDSVCVLHLVGRGQNGLGGPARKKIEYLYFVASSGDIYECIIDLDQKPSKYREFRSTGLDLALKSEGELGMDDVENWIKGSVGTYAMMQGRKVNDD